ncbi:MAG: hypothetical protein KIT17_00995 [Rubrivivax sp.]|nr:hypothetical protein [Rubrivivax sp.]
MPHDVLEQYRGKPAQNRILTGPMRVPYEAFRRNEARQYRLKVRPRLRAWERVPYSYLLRIVEDGVYGTQVGLIYSFAVIILQGRNLQPIADAIDMERCELVQQFDADRWARPEDEKAPIIERIDFHVQSKVEASDALLAEIAAAEQRRGEVLAGLTTPG